MDAVGPVRTGKVWLVGAGPGAADLLTLRAHRLVTQARVIAHDELVSQEILSLAPATAEIIPVGRRAKGVIHHHGRIHPAVLERALAGHDVVRLKGGDPLVFGRGGEEAEELARAGVPFEIVPGITAALGAAASARIPLTHRDCASRVTFVTGHPAGGPEGPSGVAEALEGTLVLYMAYARLEEACASLVASGRPPETPAALVSRATLPDERVLTGTLATLPRRAKEAEGEIRSPALLIVGHVVSRQVGTRRDA